MDQLDPFAALLGREKKKPRAWMEAKDRTGNGAGRGGKGGNGVIGMWGLRRRR